MIGEGVAMGNQVRRVQGFSLPLTGIEIMDHANQELEGGPESFYDRV